ncbi:DUF4062 domain-containing protein [Spirochaeta cellobiosiphila]|uniref:DUF4062 domain-containing protein n=1 Tax=Spirochaeta cellobiosiphila TaxID=504483 RepID=UPI000410A2B9|nr:DUF4062 domain-containing protein [Spirochaeta cellobiosiphila]
MKKKYQVFISSTYIDLIDERNAAVEAILMANHIPAGMELFKPGKEQLETINRWIDDSDIYLLILGKRYGSIDIKTGKSYTHLEYEYALEREKIYKKSKKNFPIFTIILEDEYVRNKRSDNNFYEKENVAKYEEFLNLVNSRVVKYVSSEKDLQLAIVQTLADIDKEYILDGWIRTSFTQDNTLSEQAIDVDVPMSNKDIENQLDKSICIKGRVLKKSMYNDRIIGVSNRDLTITYKEIFLTIAPFLRTENIEESVVKIFTTQLSKNIIKMNDKFKIDYQDFHKIEICFEKLGLICIKKRKDKQDIEHLYWSLTKLGEISLIEWMEI